jgi:hypothetical protein
MRNEFNSVAELLNEIVIVSVALFFPVVIFLAAFGA